MHGMSLLCVLQCTHTFHDATSYHFHSFVHFRIKCHSQKAFIVIFFFLFYSFSKCRLNGMDVLSFLVLSHLSKLVVFLVTDVVNWMCLEC